MKTRYLCLLTTLVFLTIPALAHKIGNAEWCLMYTLNHWECVYQNPDQCEETLKAVRILAKKNPSLPLVAGEENGKKIEPSCEKNPDSSASRKL